MNTRSRMPLTACATTSSVPYTSAVSMRVAPSSTPRRSGSTPPLYRHTPVPISGTISPVLPSCFNSIAFHPRENLRQFAYLCSRLTHHLITPQMIGPSRGKAQAALANHHRGYTVPSGERAVRVPVELRIVMTMKIDSAGRHDTSGRVDLAPRRTPDASADERNFALFD